LFLQGLIKTLVPDDEKREINKIIPHLLKIGTQQSYGELLDKLNEAIKERTSPALTSENLEAVGGGGGGGIKARIFQDTKTAKSPGSPILNKNSRGAAKDLQYG